MSGKDGIWFDELSGTWVARYTILTAARTEDEAHKALAAAVKSVAETWPPRSGGDLSGDSMRLEGITLHQAVAIMTFNKEEATRQHARAEALERNRKRALAAIQQVERHCPCGARPESPTTHHHVSGCPVEAALVYLADGNQAAT